MEELLILLVSKLDEKVQKEIKTKIIKYWSDNEIILTEDDFSGETLKSMLEKLHCMFGLDSALEELFIIQNEIELSCK